MLQNITWSGYLGGVAVLLVCYYLFIGAKYYREEIGKLLKGKLPKRAGTEKETVSKGEQLPDASFDELEAVVNDLRYAVFEKAGKSVSKQELLASLQQRLATYTGLQKQAYRVAMNNFIISHAKDLCGVVFSESELNAAWDALLR